MPSYASKSSPCRARARKSVWRSATIVAVIALCTSGCALAQTQVAENALTVSPIEIMRVSGNGGHASVTASMLPIRLFTTTNLVPSALYVRLTAEHPILFHELPQVTDSKRDYSLSTPPPHHPKGFFVGKASWILQQAIGDDGIEDLKHGCRVAKRLALLR